LRRSAAIRSCKCRLHLWHRLLGIGMHSGVFLLKYLGRFGIGYVSVFPVSRSTPRL